VKTRANSHSVYLEVSDNGPGIPGENIEKIFRPFFSSKGYGKGTGLGLPIVKRIVEEHKGTIQVRSAPGKGTTFVISLPVK
ncbi:MAG TPA: HAMP domain-containing sensor histidine kinase, partial [Ignavibacteria bacterium]|nr:HAMP domain-containing sensor histidine kinase [Ignavibacteria bacterium]